MSAFQKAKPRQTSGSVFEERNEQVRKTIFELELIKHVDCFLDGHGNYTSNLVSKKTFLRKSFSESQRDLYKQFGSAIDIVITHIKNPIAIKNAKVKTIVPNVRQTLATH